MKWRRTATGIVLLIALAALAAWQWREYQAECAAARRSVVASAEVVMNALVGGFRSHRRLGQFFAEQAQGVLDELAESADIKAVGLLSEDGASAISAGDASLLTFDATPPEGPHWDDAGFRLVVRFPLPAEMGGPGGGWGRAGGRGPGWRRQADGDEPSAFAPGTTVAAVLVVDHGRAADACRQAAFTRGSIVVVGFLLVVSIAVVWHATVRLADERGRARMLEVQASHYRDLSQAAAGLAHETRNPLGLIRGWTQRLAAAEIDDRNEVRRQAQAVIEECDRVTARINQFLAFARPSEPHVERFDPAEVVDELAALLEPDIDARRLTLHRLAPGRAVLADRELLRQALFNLLQNAMQASPEGAAVEIRLEPGRRGRWRLEVADRGPGVAAGVVDRLFTPYFTTRANGTGLGLAIVRRIAAAQGWQAGYSPRPDGGAVFWLDGIDA